VPTAPREQPASRSATANGATGSRAGASRVAPTAARALRVVELLATDPTRAWKLAEIQRELGYSHGNLHAIVATLVAMGYLRRDDDSRSYLLGPALLGIGAAARSAYPSVDLAAPHLERLADALDTEAHAAMRVGQTVLVVARHGRELPAGGGVQVGARLPLTPPVGSTLMAWSTGPEIEAYLATAVGALSAEAIADHRDSLRATRERGYSVHASQGARATVGEAALRLMAEGVDDVEGELTELVHRLGRHPYLLVDPAAVATGDAIQFSAPVFGVDGRVALSVGAAFGGPDVDPLVVAGAPEVLLATAAEITSALAELSPTEPATGRPR